MTSATTRPGRVALSVVGIVAGALALGWYALIFATGGLLFILLQSVYQVAVCAGGGVACVRRGCDAHA